jgi:hypothetical protein
MLFFNVLALVGITTVSCRSIGDVIRKFCVFGSIAFRVIPIHLHGYAKYS